MQWARGAVVWPYWRSLWEAGLYAKSAVVWHYKMSLQTVIKDKRLAAYLGPRISQIDKYLFSRWFLLRVGKEAVLLQWWVPEVASQNYTVSPVCGGGILIHRISKQNFCPHNRRLCGSIFGGRDLNPRPVKHKNENPVVFPLHHNGWVKWDSDWTVQGWADENKLLSLFSHPYRKTPKTNRKLEL